MNNTDLDQVLKAGTLLVIEDGEYSDRNWYGPVLVVRDVTKRELVDRYRAEWVPDDWEKHFMDGPTPGGFLPWLVQAGYVKHVDDVHSWHVGSYSQFEP